jgi:predicted Zn-dependent protease
MKKIVFITLSLLLATISYAQVVNDGGPLIDPNYAQLRYGLSGAKWNKTALKYYIYNTSAHLTAAQRETIIQAAFQRWAAVSSLSFIQVSSPSSADIKIKWVTGDHGDDYPLNAASDTLAHAFYPPPLGGDYAGEVHFNDHYTWITEGSSNGYYLLHTAIHEIGHALGIEHTNVSGSIMWPNYTGQATLGGDDILAVCNLYGAAPIYGSASSICSGNITFTSPYPQGTYTWNKSSNLTLVSTSGSTATFSKNGNNNGSGWVSVVVNNVELARKEVYVGTPVVTISGSSSVPNGQYATFTANTPTYCDPTSYQWTLNPKRDNQLYGANARVLDIAFYTAGSYQIVCRATNACGQGEYTTSGVNVYNTSSYSIAYPNPASNTLTVSFNPELVAQTQTALQSSGGVQSVNGAFLLTTKLYDNAGVLRRQATSTGQEVTFDVSSLSNGFYILHVYDGIADKPEVHKILVSH